MGTVLNGNYSPNKRDIEQAVRLHRSNADAARFLGMSYNGFYKACKKHQVSPPSIRKTETETNKRFAREQDGLS